MILEATTQLPTDFGLFLIKVYKNNQNQEITVCCSGKVEEQTDLAVRVHSACFTSEVLGSLKCDCKQQLDYALRYIAEHGGIVVYLPQEGRGIGLGNKIRAYALQERGYNTIEANEMLGLPVECRTYEDARDILNDLKVSSIQLLTNNPQKLTGLSKLGINITGRLPVPSDANSHSISYLHTKRDLMGHMLKVKTTTDNTQSSSQLSIDRRPLVHVNLALDNKGNIVGNDGQAVSISCKKDWQRVHQLREKYCAVAVGANTWLKDNPLLTARSKILGREPIKQPARVIFSGRQDCLFTAENRERHTFIVGMDKNRLTSDQTTIVAKDHELSIPLDKLNQHGIKSMLVEGGLILIDSFIKQSMVDLLTIYVRTNCITTAIQSVTETLPDLANAKIEAHSFGEGILLSSSFS